MSQIDEVTGFRAALKAAAGIVALIIAGGASATTGETLNLDGDGDRLVVRHEGALNPPDAITIEAWVYPVATGDCEAVVSKGANEGYWLGICGGEIRYYVNGLGTSFDSPDTVNPGEWTHIAVTYDGTALKQYINGNETANFYAPGELPVTTTDLGIGGDATDAASDCSTTFCEWEGGLAEVRLWNIARSQQAIREDMVRQVDSPREGLVGAWPLDGAATEVNDRFGTSVWDGAGFDFGVPAPPEPHEPVQLARLGGAPTVDGSCGGSEYGAGDWLPVWLGDGSAYNGVDPLRVRVGATSTDLYLCVDTMSLNDFDRFIVYLDTQNDGGGAPASDDYGFSIDQDGTAIASVGTGSGMEQTTVDGFEAANGGFEFDWSGELKIPRSILPGDDAEFGLHILRIHGHDGETSRHTWPVDVDTGRPDTWEPARIDDTSTPPPDSRAPAFVDPAGDRPGLGFSPEDTQPRSGVEFTIRAIANDDTDLRSVSIYVDDRRFLTREAETSCIESGSGDTYVLCTLPVTLPVGIYHMSARAVDHRGREAFAGPKRFRVVIDGEPPVIELSADPANPSPGEAVTLTAEVSDPTGVDHAVIRGGTPYSFERCELGGATEGACSMEVDPDTDVTAMRYSATAADLEGFTTERARRVVFDTGGIDSDGDGLNDDVEAALCTSPDEPDTDRDGLIDGWEVLGVRFTDGDNIDLPAMGANPCLRDVFLQLDYEEGARLPRNGVDEAVLRYRNHGINLHIEENRRPRLTNSNSLPGLRATYQQDGDGDYWFPPRRNWTHLYMFSRHKDGRSFKGAGGTITIDYDDRGDADRTYRLIHELGHGVGLGHGGRTGSREAVENPEGFFYLDNNWNNTNFKPNHRSVMSYLWSTAGPLCVTGTGSIRPDFVGRFSYSSGDMPALDESALDEAPDSDFATALADADCPDSESGATPVAIYTCIDPDESGLGSDPQARYMMVTDGTQTLARFRHGGTWDMSPPAHDPGIDWNCNGTIDSGAVSASVNGHGLSTSTRWPFSGRGEFCNGTDDNDDGTADEFCNWAIDDDPLADTDEWNNIPNLKKKHWPYDNDATDSDGNRCYRHPADYREAMGTLAGDVGPVDDRPDDPAAPQTQCPRDQVTAMADTSGVPDGGIPLPPGTELCNGLDDDGDGDLDEGCADADGDGVIDTLDNCPETANADQVDRDGDRLGDACESPEVSDLTLEQDDQSVTLDWQGTTGDVRGFVVYRETAETAAPTFVGQQYPSTAEPAFTDTPPESSYYRYTVRAVDLNGVEKGQTSAELGEPPVDDSDDDNGGNNTGGGSAPAGGGGGGAGIGFLWLVLVFLASLVRRLFACLPLLADRSDQLETFVSERQAPMDVTIGDSVGIDSEWTALGKGAEVQASSTTERFES